jgi:hypothetical protein
MRGQVFPFYVRVRQAHDERLLEAASCDVDLDLADYAFDTFQRDAEQFS